MFEWSLVCHALSGARLEVTVDVRTRSGPEKRLGGTVQYPLRPGESASLRTTLRPDGHLPPCVSACLSSRLFCSLKAPDLPRDILGSLPSTERTEGGWRTEEVSV
ncbi:hypothetical protein PAMP_002010 [Pampus punctatissimus]